MNGLKRRKMTKHFRAKHKETGEVIEFGLEDIECIGCDAGSEILLDLKGDPRERFFTGQDELRSWLKGYNLEYNHKGEWFKYE